MIVCWSRGLLRLIQAKQAQKTAISSTKLIADGILYVIIALERFTLRFDRMSEHRLLRRDSQELNYVRMGGICYCYVGSITSENVGAVQQVCIIGL